jgi:archaellum component FlaC
LKQLCEDLRVSNDKLCTEFNNFVERVHEALKDRVYTLEKKVTNLYSRASDMSADVGEGQSNPDLEARVDGLENMLNQLRDELRNSFREM